MLNDIEKGQLASTTVQCFTNGDGSLSRVPGLLKRVIEERVWERRSHHGRVIELPNLRALITTKPIQGWGQDPKKIEAVIKDDPEALAMYREAMKGEPGRPDAEKTGNNITGLSEVERVTGTSRAYSIARVQRECDAATVSKVMAGELSPNAALVQAGLRENRQIYIPRSMTEFAKKLRERLSAEDVERLKEELQCLTPQHHAR